LRKNGLRILDTLLTSYTEFVAAKSSYADPEKRAAMEDIALLLRGAIRARGQVLLKLNVPADKLAAVVQMLPAMSSPTITALANGQMNAVETVVPKHGVNTLIPALKAAGAKDILEIPIRKIVE
jgi:ATP phosphoribosyltransferase